VILFYVRLFVMFISMVVLNFLDLNVWIEKGFMDCYIFMNEEFEKCSRSVRDIVVGEIVGFLK